MLVQRDPGLIIPPNNTRAPEAVGTSYISAAISVD